MAVGYVAFEFARTDFDEGYARAMVGVHIRMNFEYESGESLFVRFDAALLCGNGQRRRRNFDETVEQLLDTERVECAAEKHRRHIGCQIIFDVERIVNAIDEFEVVAQFAGVVVADHLVELRAVQIDGHRFADALFVGRVKVEFLLIDVVHTFEFLSHVDRPTERAHADAEFGFEFVEQVERVFAFAVHFVHKNHHRRFAHGANLHQFACLRLDAFGCIDHNDDAIDGCECAERVFGKILVTGRVENVDFVAFVLETHHRCGHRNAALLLYLHPVGCGGFFDFVRLDGSGHMDGATEKQQFFGQSGFAGIGVRNDGKRAPTVYFRFKHIFEKCEWFDTKKMSVQN